MTQTEPAKPKRADGDVGSAEAAQTLVRALTDYVRAVADAVGVPADGVTCEVTDTATAYLALASESASHPGRDTMLVWNEKQGWVILVETTPTEPPIVLSRAGDDLVPPPAVVARMVADSITRVDTTSRPTAPPPRLNRAELAERMIRHSHSR